MGRQIELQATDGHRFAAWLAEPEGKPRGGLVVLQEIFGVTPHLRHVTDRFAADGYLAIAPALFDRVRPGVDLPYEEVAAARQVMTSLHRANTILDMSAAVEAVRKAGGVGAIGYCWGGALADLAACECDIDAAVSYYGRHTASWLELQPKCPVMYHFGKLDPYIPPETVAAIEAGRPQGTFYIYDQAGHGFNCDERHDYHAASAELALQRTREVLQRHVG